MTPPAYYRTDARTLQLPPLWLIGLVLLTLAVVASWATAGGPAGKPLSKPFLNGVHAEVRNLRAEVERLQGDFVFDPAAQKDRDLYRLTAAVLAEVTRFEHGLKAETSAVVLHKRFETLDGLVRQLVAATRKSNPGGALQRAVDHVANADEELYYALAGGDSRHAGQVTERQAHAFTDAVFDLQRTAKYALGASLADRAVLIDNVAKLAIAAERFEKSLRNKEDLKQRQADFAGVDKAWSRVVQGLTLLKPVENVHLLRSAARVDRLHERMYRLLDIKGKRPSLSVQS